MVLVVKNMPVSTGDERDLSLILGSEDPLEEGMATHWSCLEWVAWRTPWIQEPGWQATIHGHHKESDRSEAIEHNTAQSILLPKENPKKTNSFPFLLSILYLIRISINSWIKKKNFIVAKCKV